MAIDFIIIKDQENSLATRYIQAYLRNNGGQEIRVADEVIAIGAPLSGIDLQAAWDRGVAVPNGINIWDALKLRDSDAIYDLVIRAMLNQLRDGGGVGAGNTLPLITNAGKAALATSQNQTDAVTRLTAIFKAATGPQQADFLMLMAVLTASKLGTK